MTNETAKPKQSMERWAKAYILALVIFGIGMIGARIEDGSMLLSAGLLGGAVCAIIGTVWVVQDKLVKRR